MEDLQLHSYPSMAGSKPVNFKTVLRKHVHEINTSKVRNLQKGKLKRVNRMAMTFLAPTCVADYSND